jgi:hypothetical protein
MLNRGVQLGFGFLALLFATSAAAQANLDRGKTGIQLFTSACATCHKSPKDVTRTKWFFGLENFLRQHYTSSAESAAVLAAYLKQQVKLSSSPARLVRHTSQTTLSGPTVDEFGDEILRPPADIPDLKR